MIVKSKSGYKEYILSLEDYELLVAAAKGKIVGSWQNDGQTEQGRAERLNYAWFTLGVKYGFDPWSVLPITYNKILAYELSREDWDNLKSVPNV